MGPLGITTGHDSLNAWQVLAVEFLLTFVVIFTTYATYDANRRSFGSDSLSIGIAYLVASLTGVSERFCVFYLVCVSTLFFALVSSCSTTLCD